MSRNAWPASGVWLALFTLCAPGIGAAQTLETETARLMKAGWWEIGNALELQTSSEGTEAAIPMAVEYGFRDNLELLVEPVPYTAIRPKVGRRATGLGDVEATLSYRFGQEHGWVPALAFAAEVKIPTARDALIGSREPDYTGYVIASKRFGRFDAHANIAYTLVGRMPDTAQLNNTFNFAVAGVYEANARLEVFGEALATTASVPGAETPGGNTVTPEASGGELVGTLGAGWRMGTGLVVYFSASFDNNNALLLRPGFTVKFR